MLNTKLIIILYIVVASVVKAASNDVVVDKMKLFVNGEEYFIKAMCYNPVPLGAKYMDANGNQGGGYCSPKMTAQGDWKSACYDSDYFDGSCDDPNRVPPGPASWFSAVWERDFPVIQSVGANTLRIYNANPTTLQASQDPANNFPYPRGKDHIPFLDLAQTYGFKVIFPLFGDSTYLTNSPATQIQQYLRWQIDEVGNHSAILMFTLGNELNLNGNSVLVNLVNGYISYARQYMTSKWSRTVPITTALVDLPDSYPSLMRDLNVDVFTTNAGYRGFDFSDLWSNPTDGLFQLSCTYNKPVFIGEIGWMSNNASVNTLYPNWVNRIWQDLVNHIDAGCIGGAFFEYSNEPYTKSDILQLHMGIVDFQVNGNSDQPNVFKTDNLVHMPYLFDALSSGTYEGVAYNMNSDPFTLIGRPSQLLSNAQGICSGSTYTTPAPNPSASTPSPSTPTTPSPSSSTTPSPSASSSGTGTVPMGTTGDYGTTDGCTGATTSYTVSTTSTSTGSSTSTPTPTSSPSGSTTPSPTEGGSSSDGDDDHTTPEPVTTPEPLEPTTTPITPTGHTHSSDSEEPKHTNSAPSHILSVSFVLAVVAIFSIVL